MAKEILCAFSLDFDAVSVWLGTFGAEKSPSDISRGMFGGEVGVPRLLKLFQRFGIKTSWFVPGHSIETFPDQTRMIVEAGHQIGLHGYTHEDPQAMTAEQEEIVLDRCIELIETASGRRPTGYVAPNWEYSASTLRLLLKKGIKYDHNLMHRDFEPYYVRDRDQWTAVDWAARGSAHAGAPLCSHDPASRRNLHHAGLNGGRFRAPPTDLNTNGGCELKPEPGSSRHA